MPEFNFKSPIVTRKVREDADGRVILDKSINYGK